MDAINCKKLCIHSFRSKPVKISGGSTGGGARGAIAHPRLGPKKFIARPKNTHLQTPFCMPECAKTHLQQSRISKFSGGGLPDPLFKGRGGEGRGGEGGEGKGRIGKGGEGREGTGAGRREEGRNEGGGEGHSTWAPPVAALAIGLRGSSPPPRFLLQPLQNSCVK